MASRTKQKEAARARRIAEEQARAEHAERQRRMRMLGGVVIAAVAIVVVVVVISVSGSSTPKPVKANSSASRATEAAVNKLLTGIPQSGETLGNPKAPVTVTEFADLDCPVCDAFALPSTSNTSDGTPATGYFDQLVNQYVRTGKVKVVYRSLETASGTANGSMWPQQQAAAYAAGLQDKAWQYIETWYYEQQSEDTSYVNPAYMQGIAQQVPGLNLSSWEANRQNSNLEAQVTNDGNAAASKGYTSTPTLVVQGPKGQANAIVGLPSSFSQLSSEISSVS